MLIVVSSILITLPHQNLVCSAAIFEEFIVEYRPGDRYFYFPGDGDGITHLVDALEPYDKVFLNNLKTMQNNTYWLFTRSNPTTSQVLLYGDNNSVVTSNFAFNKVTVFLAHGWKGHGANNMNVLLTEAFLEDDDVNVIVVDWSVLANRNYVTAKRGVVEVGRGLGLLINWLNTLGLSYEKVHLVGFSLGGHLVGVAGRTTDSKVKRITSLDPAGPLWVSDNNRVAPTDAQYVEIIHTNAGVFGFTDVCGHADFYPNGGSNMNGCILNSCSHNRAFEYMASSVKHNHLFAYECSTHRDAMLDSCSRVGDLYPMGNSDLSKSRHGIFRVNTQPRYPY